MPIYRAIYAGPPKGFTAVVTRKLYVMVHCTANARLASAADEASYARWRPDRVSSHYYVDAVTLLQSLDTDFRAWHSGSVPGNDSAISYEAVGLPTWTRRQWLDRVAWELLAAAVARDCQHHDITPRDLSVSQIRGRGKSGFATHNEARLVWGGTDHTCPGPNFPMDHLVALVRGEPGGRGGGAPLAGRPAPGPEVAWPLPAGYFFGPAAGPSWSVSGVHRRRFAGRPDREWLQVWTRQLDRRGWPVGRKQRYLTRFGNDGIYGAEYGELIRAWQRDQGLPVDGLLGPVSWRAAWRNPVTP